MINKDDISINYWTWFLRGSGYKPGYTRILNRWIIVHLIIGTVISFLVTIDLIKAANVVLFPLAGILVGLSFAWAGNAQALMQTDEIHKLAEYHKGGFVEYVFIYQTAILIILVTLVFWGLAGLEVFNNLWPTTNNIKTYFIIKILLFTLSSLTLRACWHVVSGANWMLRIQRDIRHRKERNNK